MAGVRTPKKRQRGGIDVLPSGALRVRVYAGVDPVSKREHYLKEIIPAGPTAEKDAEKARTRLVNEVDERRNPRTNATVGQLIDRYFGVWEGDPGTLDTYRDYERKHIAPLLGKRRVGAVDADMLDAFYAELRRCRDHCDGSARVDHRLAITSATKDAGRTSAPDSAHPRSDTSTSYYPARTSARCGGDGWP